MGILFDDAARDEEEIKRIFEISLEVWNSKHTNQEGVLLAVNDEAIAAASHLGGEIIIKALPDPPDAFKRVAAMLVMMGVNPFIIGRVQNQNGLYVTVLQGDDLRDFAIRFAIDSLPLLFNPLDQQKSSGEWVEMKWPGFFSSELRDEFIKLIRSISKSDIIEWRARVITYNQVRLSRAVLSVSLTLKSVYGPVG